MQIVAKEPGSEVLVDEISDVRDLLKMDPDINYVLTADIDLTGVVVGRMCIR